MEEFGALVIVSVFVGLLVFAGYSINDDEVKLLKINAVKSGAAEWVTDLDTGRTNFQWKNKELNDKK